MIQEKPSLPALIQALLERDPPRAKSLCVTLLGDVIQPHGGKVWLSDLISLVTPLGINERLLRTSVFRLVAQDWLQSERHGRRSLYQLSPRGAALTLQASTRIYDGDAAGWNGDWTLVVVPRFGNSSLDRRGELRRQLVWAGFGVIAPGVFALPRNHAGAAREILDELGLAQHALVLGAGDLNEGHGANRLLIRSLISQCWDLEGLAQQYQMFSATFKPMLQAMDVLAPTPEQAFAVRALTLHEWRRIVLQDPQLPGEMLPADWPGRAARALCGELYWAVFDQAETHLLNTLGADSVHFQALPAPYASRRFGGRPA